MSGGGAGQILRGRSGAQSILKPSHAGDKIRFRSLQRDVLVVGHQDPTEHAPSGPFTCLLESAEEGVSIRIGKENIVVLVAARHHMVDGTGKLNAKGTWHAAN